MTGISSLPPTSHTGNTLQLSWELTNQRELVDWLHANADRLTQRAKREADRTERDRLLRMAAAAIETAGWYQSGGAR